MGHNHEYICKIKKTVLCELCNKSYTIGVMKKHKQTKMPIENANNRGVKKLKRPIKMPIENAKNRGVKKQKRPIKEQKRTIKMHIENGKNRAVPSW
jgi:hypothetical protein